MRAFVLASTLTLISSNGFAGSIDTIVSPGKNSPSQTIVSCDGCTPAPKPPGSDKPAEKIWTSSDLQVEVKDVNGTKKRFSKEAWFGGSPVVFVTKEPGQTTIDAAANQPLPGVDPSATTSALNTPEQTKPVAASMLPAAAEQAANPAPAPASDPVAPAETAETPPPPSDAPMQATANPPPAPEAAPVAAAEVAPPPAPVAETTLDTSSMQLRLN